MEWQYGIRPADGGDSRKLVTLEQDGFVWVGIRHWNSAKGYWVNTDSPETAKVLAWAELPKPALKRFIGGKLT
jgi:hypothetical protein